MPLFEAASIDRKTVRLVENGGRAMTSSTPPSGPRDLGEQVALRSIHSDRDRRSQQNLLCALCAPLCELCGESRWLRRHRRLGLGDSPATPIFVAVPHFST